MADADLLLREGDLAGARAALVQVVRSQPSNVQARMFLFQLLAVAGEWDKAKSQLTALTQISAETQMLAAAYGQAIEAEGVRAAVFAGTQRVDVLANGDGWAGGLAVAIEHFACGRDSDGEAARDEAFAAAPDLSGTFNGIPFEWIADADARFGPSCEVIVAGRYGILPLDSISHMTSEGARDLRDLVWLPVQIMMRSGQSIAAFLPSRYPGTEASGAAAEQLARATSWLPRGSGEVGLGQRLWTLSDGEDHGILSLRNLQFS